MARAGFFSVLLILFLSAARDTQAYIDLDVPVPEKRFHLGKVIVGKRNKHSGQLDAVGCVNDLGHLAPADSLLCTKFVHGVGKASIIIIKKECTEALMNLTAPTPEGSVLITNTHPQKFCGIMDGRLACDDRLIPRRAGFPPYSGPITPTAVGESFPLPANHCVNNTTTLPCCAVRVMLTKNPCARLST